MICLTSEILEKKEQTGIIKDIKTRQNSVYLIKKEMFAKNWQHPDSVTDYIIQNYKKIGEIDIYDIYEK